MKAKTSRRTETDGQLRRTAGRRDAAFGVLLAVLLAGLFWIAVAFLLR